MTGKPEVSCCTGKVGSEVIKELVKRNVNVRALVRKQEASTEMPKGVEIIQGDLLDPVSVRKALEGVDKLYLLNAVVPDGSADVSSSISCRVG